MAVARLFKHNPVFLNENELSSSFVVRVSELQFLKDVIRENTGPVNQHVIIIGPRGTGKTMLVRRLALAVKQDAALSKIWYPIVLPEELYNVSSEGELWLRVLEYIVQQEKDAGREFDRWLKTHETLRGERSNKRLQIQSLSILSEFSQQRGLKLLVIMENLQMVLGEQTSSDEAWNLRRTLLNNPEIMLVTTATTHFKEIVNVKNANYDLFREISLEPLSTDDCRILWNAVADEDLVDDRIRPMEILTGGSPRLLAILANFAKGRSLAQLMDDLVILIDDHTTYFKANVEALPPMERRVYVTLAELWEQVEAKKVAERCRLDVNKTSALLKKLVVKGAVTEKGKVGRKNLYQIAERLYNIYHLLRLSSTEADRVKRLVRFMIPLYGEETLACALAEEACRQDGEERHEWIEGYKEILTIAKSNKKIIDRIYQITPKDFYSLPEIKDITRKFEEMKFQYSIARQEDSDFKQKAYEAFQKGDLEGSINYLNSAISYYDNSNTPKWQEELAMALVNKGYSLGSLGRSEEAIAVYDEVIARFADIDEPALREQVAMALVNKGITLGSLGRSQEEIAVYDEVIARFADIDEPALREQVAMALFNKGITLGSLGRSEEAIAVYDEVIARFADIDEPALREKVARALVNKGNRLGSLGRSQEEIAVYDEVIARFADIDEPALREQVARALNGRAWKIYEKEDYPMVSHAVEDIKNAISINPQSTYRHTLACLLALQCQWDEALEQAREFSDDESMLKDCPNDIIDFFIYAAASGQAEAALKAVKSTKIKKAMEPLIVSLKMYTGRPVRAPREVLEVAKDIVKRIEKKAGTLTKKIEQII